MLTEKEVKELVQDYGTIVNEGRSIGQIVSDGDLPRLEGAEIYQGKVSDSVYGGNLVIKDGTSIRLMYRSSRISTHDHSRGNIPFKDQVLAHNHDYMLELVGWVLGSSQFVIPGLEPSSTVIVAENLTMIKLEAVFRRYMAESSTSTSLYQHWLKAKKYDCKMFDYAGHRLDVDRLTPNGILPYIIYTPSTKDKNDLTIDPQDLINQWVCSEEQNRQIRNNSMMAFGIVAQDVRNKGMELVDTKKEFGFDRRSRVKNGDELYTLDSSRYWKLDDDGKIMLRDGKPISFSKEFARGMVTKMDQEFTSEQAQEIAVRYILGLQHLTGKEFKPDLRNKDERIIESTNLILDYLL